jgi:5-methyltetrahydrofolate--homocysteine methyltransferase
MSGLLVKSTAFMKDNLATFNEAGITVPVILGGAALTPKFVHRRLPKNLQGQEWSTAKMPLLTCISWTS